MNNAIVQIRKWEFEARIFISLSLVLSVCLISYVVLKQTNSVFVSVGSWFQVDPQTSKTTGFLAASLFMIAASTLRMWAGSILSSHRVMSFKVKNDALMTDGPYGLVRNPIYLADLIAMVGFTFCLPSAGLILPLLFSAHYVQLILYEEASLAERFGEDYQRFAAGIPRLIPDITRTRVFLRSLGHITMNKDGIRNNALYLLFIPGFVVSAFTGRFTDAVFIGLPAVLDWAVLHTKKGLPASTREKEQKPFPKQKRQKVFDDILYAQCWEDPELDRAALHIQPDDIVFSITSGGCNTLAFLIDNPKKIIALDANIHQSYLLDLKIAAFRSLSYGEMLEFMGVRTSSRRQELYVQVREGLKPESRTYWDEEAERIEAGIIHCGRYEAYMEMLRRWLGRLIGQATLEKFFEIQDLSERHRFYQEKWETPLWWLFTRILLSRTVMTLVFDKAFFRYLDSSFSFGENFANKVKHAMTELPARDNYFLSYILLGRYYDEAHLPPYLWREHFTSIRGRLNKIEVVTASCEEFFQSLPSNTLSKFNFTNIFEWMSPENYEQVLKEIVRVSKNRARITYRNLLVPRERPASLAGTIESLRPLARELHFRDLSFIYDNYVVEQIRKGNAREAGSS